mmetsp:Transcript_21132/g.42973  ORF Transcript_21132/g.42973 Transcript_21132/m.42973 type:complete len:83 (-) Transcript_21132:535-783(-)
MREEVVDDEDDAGRADEIAPDGFDADLLTEEEPPAPPLEEEEAPPPSKTAFPFLLSTALPPFPFALTATGSYPSLPAIIGHV